MARDLFTPQLTRRRLRIVVKTGAALILLSLLLGVRGATAYTETIPAVTVEFPPFDFSVKDGRIVGATTEIVEAVLARLGHEITLHAMPTKRAQALAGKGEYALFFTLTKNPVRESLFHFTDPVATIADFFFKREGDPITWTRMDDLRGKIIGATEGYNYAPVFLEAWKNGTLEVDGISSLTPELQHLRKLKEGRIDLAICERSVCNYLLQTWKTELSGLTRIDRNIGPVRTFHVAISRNWPGAETLLAGFIANLPN